ncbi:hypothetical protein N2599_22065 (plasmid) [Rhizobium sullae]|uniref:Uncharacterized protein n=1 Tax=Rhizobium sullae TaxID=50338 RepID=A0A2N0D1U2_RHISU|nr:hypothetical protein [Rhizobium sullae]PKA40074.1 hypothetical protein CWR43_29665 [Rhizobium sullae]UWU17989.1 hypothetical protein N2599_22065 [Rhizobium sullae]
MSHKVALKKRALSSNDLSMLDGLLKEWCESHHYDILNLEAQEAARELVMWFEFGVDKPHQLRELLATR